MFFKIMHVYDPLHNIETIMETGGPIYGGEGVDEMALARSSTLDESLRFLTYMMFVILESLLKNIHLYYKDCSNKWDRLHLDRFSTENIILLLCFENLLDIFLRI